MSKECPECKQNALITIYGNMWDWDIDLCHNRDCHYEVELDVMTCYEEDGTLIVLQKPIEDDEDE